MRYVVFDTETPNSRNDRMCQIGLCLVENGQIFGAEGFLVNPECEFALFNVMLHGITPERTCGEPNFAELWTRELESIFSDGILVAHNAPFDMAVLSKCLRAYGIRWRERAPYIDTVRMARQAFPSLPNHKLDTLAYTLGVELDHHDAASDAAACARILLSSMERGVDAGEFVREYDLECARTLAGSAR